MRCCAVEGICVVCHIWSSLLFSLENSWWSLAVHHSIYHQCFVIVCRNSHKVEFSVDILCCDFFRDFHNVPKTNADSWSLLNAQRKGKAVPFFETNPALQPCPPCPWKASRITQWTRLERDNYICNRKFMQVLLGGRVCEVMKCCTEALFQTSSSSSQVTQQDKWDQHWLWAGTTQCWVGRWDLRQHQDYWCSTNLSVLILVSCS